MSKHTRRQHSLNFLFVWKNLTLLGIEHLDEPASSQTDAQILIMQLRAQNKTSFRREVCISVRMSLCWYYTQNNQLNKFWCWYWQDEVIGAIDHAEKNTTAIDKWISNVSLLHGSLHTQKPKLHTQYSFALPIDLLGQSKSRCQKCNTPRLCRALTRSWR